MKQPLCRYCGKPIPKRTRNNFITTNPDVAASAGLKSDFSQPILVTDETWPVDRAACQKLTSQQVISISRANGARIHSFSSWDGETYVDEFFCNATHARDFGHACAKAGYETPSYQKAIQERGEAAVAWKDEWKRRSLGSMPIRLTLSSKQGERR